MDGVPDDGSSTFSFIQTTTFSYAVRAISKRNMDASIPPQIRGDGHTNHCATYVRFLATNYIVSQGFGILMANKAVMEMVGRVLDGIENGNLVFLESRFGNPSVTVSASREMLPNGRDAVVVRIW